MPVKSAMVTTARGCAQVKTKSYGLPEKGTVRCHENSGNPIAEIKKLENRANPAAMDAAELDSPTVECIQPNRNPHTGPSPFRKYAYCPPASGNAAPSSAKDSAPNSDSSPPAIHAAYTTLTEPPTDAISLGFRNIPVPTIVPTTMADAAHAPSPRTRSRRFAGFVGVVVKSFRVRDFDVYLMPILKFSDLILLIRLSCLA